MTGHAGTWARKRRMRQKSPNPGRIRRVELYKRSVNGRKLRCNCIGVSLAGVNAPCPSGISAELWAMLSISEKIILRDAPLPASGPGPVADAAPAPFVMDQTEDLLERGWKLLDPLAGMSEVLGVLGGRDRRCWQTRQWGG